ncbi:MAG: hypothetical protein IKW76_00820 [Clostridia bacterium]|nr:hypothetical protein [Clostridia bacterium]
MKRIIALILSFLMSILGALGIAVPSGDGTFVKQGEWLALVIEDFGIAKQDVEIPYEGIPAEYLDIVKTAYGYGTIVDSDKIDVDAYATNAFVAATIKRTSTVDVDIDIPESGLKAKFPAKLDDALAALDVAVKANNNKQVPAVAQSEVEPQAGVVDLSAAEYSVVGDKLVYAAADFKLAAGDKFIAGANEYNISGAAYEVKGVQVIDGAAIVDVAPLALEEAVEAVDFEGTVDVDAKDATVYDNNGNVVEIADEPAVAGQGFIKDKTGELIDKGVEAAKEYLNAPHISFSIKGFKVKAALNNGRVDLSIGGNVCDGVYVEKLYTMSNIKIDAKYNANIKKLDIKEAYVKTNYDLVETTVITGSYAGSVVPEGGSFTNEGANFLEKVKNNLSNLTLQPGGGQKVNIFTYEIPIGTTGLTVEMNVSLTLSVNGRIEIIVTSNETKGYEIINNKGRVIHESTVYDRAFNISGDFRAVLGLDLSLTFLTFKIIDVEVSGGVGAYVLTKVFNVKTHTTTTSDVPLDVAVEAASGLDDLEDLRFCADVTLYGILSVSVGRNSILSKIGLYKTWNIYDRDNGTFAHLHIENSGIVDQCSYAA